MSAMSELLFFYEFDDHYEDIDNNSLVRKHPNEGNYLYCIGNNGTVS